MSHEIQVDAVKGTVWVNHGDDGSCVGRFSKRFGMDIHNSLSDQLAGKPQCLHCTHTPGLEEDWLEFVRLMKHHFDIRIDPRKLKFEVIDGRS